MQYICLWRWHNKDTFSVIVSWNLMYLILMAITRLTTMLAKQRSISTSTTSASSIASNGTSSLVLSHKNVGRTRDKYWEPTFHIVLSQRSVSTALLLLPSTMISFCWIMSPASTNGTLWLSLWQKNVGGPGDEEMGTFFPDCARVGKVLPQHFYFYRPWWSPSNE